MMNENRRRAEEMINSLKQQRDELALKVRLAEAEAREEWERLDDKYAQLIHRFEPVKRALEETADEVWESLKLLGEEVNRGYDRIRRSL